MMNKKQQKEFLKFLEDFPAQIRNGQKLVENILPLKLDKNHFQNIVVLGMGGSAIAGDILAGYVLDQLDIPILINRNYHLPSYVSHKSLVIASSYSGNTEETLQAVEEAIEKKCTIITITSGGKLGEIAKEKGFPWIQLPEGYPPRQAFGFSFFSLLHFFRSIGWIEVNENELKEALNVAEHILEKQHPGNKGKKHISFDVANSLYKKIPIIYTGCPWLYGVARRIQNQFHENSKVLSFSNVLPEMNHNEIVGWEMDSSLLQNLGVIFLRDENEESKMGKRMEITHRLIAQNCNTIVELYPEGKSRLAKITSLIYLGDWISYYLSILYDKDPKEIKNIDLLKNELSR